MTTSLDILNSLTTENGPEKFIIALGYAGWGAKQLEQEILDNSWLTVPAKAEILFDLSYSDRWQAAATILGVDMNQLSSETGHA